MGGHLGLLNPDIKSIFLGLWDEYMFINPDVKIDQ